MAHSRVVERTHGGERVVRRGGAGVRTGDGKHSIAYDDGTEETINFGEEKVEAAAADEE